MKEYFDMIIAKWLCCHEWELEQEAHVFNKETDKMPYKRKYTYICKKCGKFKMFDR